MSRYIKISNDIKQTLERALYTPWRPSNNPSLVRSVPLHSQPRSSTLTPNHRFEELNAKIAAEFTLNRLSKMIKGKESVAVSKVKVVVSWAANLSADQNRPKLCCYETSMTRAKRSLYLALPLLMNNAGWTTKKCLFSEFQLCFQKRTAKDTSLPCVHNKRKVSVS